MPVLSVIVPVLDSPTMLAVCLASIRKSTFTDYELLIADDGSPSPEEIRVTAERFGARTIQWDRTRGPAAARNQAARLATGAILVFIDADCIVHADTLERFAEAFRRDPKLDAIMGSYDFQPRVRGLVATFRNLLHAFVHHRSSHEAATFWTGCGAMRRQRFETLGGFDESYRRAELEDVELGMRLHAAGGHLALDPEIQVSHHKEWTLASMLRDDTCRRAMPWTELMYRHGLPWDLAFRWQERASAGAAILLPALVFLALRYGHAWIGLACCALLAIAVLQWPLLRFLARQRGAPFAAVSLPLFIAHQLAGATGLVLGVCRCELKRDRWLPWVAGGLAALIFVAFQIGGGAYRAEFDGHPDECAHFMSGLIVRDFLALWPARHPLAWAEQYYVHYPKVALGHWPPLFHMLEAAWWLFLPPARWSAMLLIGFLGLACAVLFYRTARRTAHPAVAGVLAALLVATPVFQESLEQTMAEMLSLLFGLLFLDALVRIAGRGPIRRLLIEASLWCILCLLVKGTGAVLIAAPLLVFGIRGEWNALRNRALWLAFAALLGGSAVAFTLLHGSVGQAIGWGGLRLMLPWSIGLVPQLAGGGVLVLAAAGLVTWRWSNSPSTAAAAALALSVVISSFFLRAMNEPRHWILALPPILLLAAAFLHLLGRIRIAWIRRAAVSAGAALGLAAFPWQYYRQEPGAHAAILDRLQLPARALVSSAISWHEGAWIVMVSLREQRPASVIARASKLLAVAGWSYGYRLLFQTPGEVEQTLDRYGIETVILDDRQYPTGVVEHHPLLKRTLSASPQWRECGANGGFSLWCRVSPPQTERQPMHLKTSGRSGAEILER
jgi:GT2 family glycosyltransferase